MSVQGLEARALKEMKALEQGYDNYPVSIHWIVTSHAQEKRMPPIMFWGLSLLHMSLLSKHQLESSGGFRTARLPGQVTHAAQPLCHS